MGDEDLYLQATNEVEANAQEPALWAKSMTLAEGDTEKAKYQYVKLRVAQIKEHQKDAVIQKDETIKQASKKRTKTRTISARDFACKSKIPLEKVIEMIHENKLEGHAVGDAWYIKVPDGDDDGLADGESGNGGAEIEQTRKGFFSALSNGDFGLAKTYWLYGVVVGFIANIVAGLITNTKGLVVFLLLYSAYQILVLVGVWRASDKYQGPSVWTVLAKIMVIAGAVMLVAGFLVIAGLIGR